MSFNTTENLIKVEKCADFFRVLAHETRLQIVDFLIDGPRSVSEIQEHLNITQTLASINLKLMLRSGIVMKRRDGKNMFYSLVPGIIEKTSHMLDDLLDPV
jgi:ArsR family transcriptional regulator, nickel/cobalt-responsive transcriptional repressor